MHNVRACKEAQSCSTSKISTTCLVRCRKERTVRCGEVYREWKHVAHGYPRTGSPDEPPKDPWPERREGNLEKKLFMDQLAACSTPRTVGALRGHFRAAAQCPAPGTAAQPPAADVPARTAMAAAIGPSTHGGQWASRTPESTAALSCPAKRCGAMQRGTKSSAGTTAPSATSAVFGQAPIFWRPAGSEVGCAFSCGFCFTGSNGHGHRSCRPRRRIAGNARVCDGKAQLEAHHCAEERSFNVSGAYSQAPACGRCSSERWARRASRPGPSAVSRWPCPAPLTGTGTVTLSAGRAARLASQRGSCRPAPHCCVVVRGCQRSCVGCGSVSLSLPQPRPPAVVDREAWRYASVVSGPVQNRSRQPRTSASKSAVAPDQEASAASPSRRILAKSLQEGLGFPQPLSAGKVLSVGDVADESPKQAEGAGGIDAQTCREASNIHRGRGATTHTSSHFAELEAGCSQEAGQRSSHLERAASQADIIQVGEDQLGPSWTRGPPKGSPCCTPDSEERAAELSPRWCAR